jgi:hypothetical protein
MKYQLSNCEIEQLSDSIFEATPKEGIVVDKKCVDECWKHWDDTQQEQFGLLINCKHAFSFSFEGARDIYNHPLQQKTAIFVDKKDYESQENITFILRVKETSGLFLNCEIFTDRDEAIEWLSDV